MKRLNDALKVAIKGRGKNQKQYHLGCIAIRSDGSVVSAFNSRSRHRAPSLHAEVKALKKAGKANILYISRVMADGSWGLAKPCDNCIETIKKHKVKRVYYTISHNEYGVIKI